MATAIPAASNHTGGDGLQRPPTARIFARQFGTTEKPGDVWQCSAIGSRTHRIGSGVNPWAARSSSRTCPGPFELQIWRPNNRRNNRLAWRASVVITCVQCRDVDEGPRRQGQGKLFVNPGNQVFFNQGQVFGDQAFAPGPEFAGRSARDFADTLTAELIPAAWISESRFSRVGIWPSRKAESSGVVAPRSNRDRSPFFNSAAHLSKTWTSFR